MPVIVPLVALAVSVALSYSGVIAVALATIGITGTIAAIGATLIGAAISYGVTSLLDSALGINKSPSAAVIGATNPSQTVRQPISSHKLLLGQFRVGGAITFLDVNGGLNVNTSNNYLIMVVTMGGRRFFQFQTFYFGDTIVPLDGSGNAVAPGTLPDGSMPQSYAGFASLVGGIGSNPGDASFLSAMVSWTSKWTSDCKQYGRPKVAMRLQWDQTTYGTTGIPNLSVISQGRMCYDPRITGKTISSSTAASPGLFSTSSAHGLSVGTPVWIKNHSGATYTFNGNTYSVKGEYEVNTVPSSTTFTLLGPDFNPLTLTHAGTGGTVTAELWTDNAALLLDDYFCDQIYGLEADYQSEIPEAQLISAANSCDEIVARTNLSTTFTADSSTDLITYALTGTAGNVAQYAQVTVSNSGGALPSGLSANTVYYFVVSGATNSGHLATSLSDAQTGVFVNFTSNGTGTQTLTLTTTFGVDTSSNTIEVYSTALRILTGTQVQVASNGGSLPSGLSASTNYYAILVQPDTLQLASSLANARAGVAISITSAGSGVLTIIANGEPRYTCNGVTDTSLDRKSILQQMLTTLGGYVVANGVSLPIYPAVYVTPTVTLDENDARDALKLVTLQSGQVSFNSVKGAFYDPFSSWLASDLPVYQSSSYITDDNNNTIWADYPLPYTNSPSMGQRLFKINLERVRREMGFTYPCKLTAFRIAAADNVFVNNTLWGLSSATFEVRSWSFSAFTDGNGNQALGTDLNLQQTDSDVFSWTSASERAVRSSSQLPQGPPIGLLPAPNDFAVSQIGSGASVQFNWSEIDSPFVAGYTIEAGPAGGNLSGATLITNKLRGTTVTAALADGNYTGYAFGVDIYGTAGDVSTYDFAVVGSSFIPITHTYTTPGSSVEPVPTGASLLTVSAWGGGQGGGLDSIIAFAGYSGGYVQIATIALDPSDAGRLFSYTVGDGGTGCTMDDFPGAGEETTCSATIIAGDIAFTTGNASVSNPSNSSTTGSATVTNPNGPSGAFGGTTFPPSDPGMGIGEGGAWQSSGAGDDGTPGGIIFQWT